MIRAAILTYKRPGYFRRTLKSFIDMNGSLLERKKIKLMIVIQDQPSIGTVLTIRRFWKWIHDVRIKSNQGIGGGYSFVMDENIRLGADLILYLEDDWECREPLEKYWDEIMDLFEIEKNVGYIRLRTQRDRTNFTNRFRLDVPSRIIPEQFSENIILTTLGFSWNPQIIRADVIDQIIPLYNEKDAAIKYAELRMDTAKLMANVFHHIGTERTPIGRSRFMTEEDFNGFVKKRKERV